MKRILFILLVFLILVPVAQADNDPFTESSNDRAMLNTLQDVQSLPQLPPGAINSATGSPYSTLDEYSGLSKARMAGGFLPVMNAIGSIWMGGSAIYSAYQIGSLIRQKISGDTGASVGTFVPHWNSFCNAGTGPQGSSCAVQTNNSAVTWTSDSSPSASSATCGGSSGLQYGTGAGTCIPQGWYQTSGGNLGGIFCTTAGLSDGCTQSSASETSEANSIVAQGNVTVFYNVFTGSGYGNHAGDSFFITRTFDQMYKATHVSTCDSSCYNGANLKIDKSTTTLQTGNTYINNAYSVCGGYLGGTVGTADQEACRAALNYLVKQSCATDGTNCAGSGTNSTTVTCSNCSSGTSGGSAFLPFVIPQPQSDETYTDYLERLREKGWVGTATITTVGTDSVLTGANGVVSVQDTTTSAGPDAISAWPDNPLSVSAADDALTLFVNSSVAPAVSSSDTSRSIDWSPLESISFGTSFPFGIPNWISDFFSQFSFGGSCPTLTLPNMPLVGSFSQSFCSTEWEMDWRSVTFLILECLMTAAGVIWLALKIIGLNQEGE